MSASMEQSVQDLQQLVSELIHRVNYLEAELNAFPHRHADDPSEEEMLAISAAVSAFLGHRALPKQIHVRRRGGWARKGREGIQESHTIRHHAPRQPVGH